MNSFCEKIAIGSQFLLALLGFSVTSMGLGAIFYALFRVEDIINEDSINLCIFKLLPTGALIFIAILLLWFIISYIIGTIYTKLKSVNFFKGGK